MDHQRINDPIEKTRLKELKEDWMALLFQTEFAIRRVYLRSRTALLAARTHYILTPNLTWLRKRDFSQVEKLNKQRTARKSMKQGNNRQNPYEILRSN